MYAQILFLFCAYIHIIKTESYDTDEAKYIDLLPEQEKREFLDRIARRIMAEIKAKDGGEKASVEVSDERLNEHAAYVQKIMDEETENLKTQRRTVNELKSEIGKYSAEKNNDLIEVNMKTLENDGEKVQEAIENVDLSTSENKIRIKKGTTEDNKHTSKENVDRIEHTVSAIPVHLLYEDEGSFKSTVKSIKLDNSENTPNESLENKGQGIDSLSVLKLDNQNQVSLEKLDINNNEEIKQSVKESKEKEPDESLKIVRGKNSEVNDIIDAATAKPQTVIVGFDPDQEEVYVHNNTAENWSERVNVKKYVISEKSVETHVENVTENALKTSSVFNNLETVTSDDKQSTVEPTSNFITILEGSYKDTDNILNNSEPTLNTNEYERKDINSSINTAEFDANVTETYLEPATPSYDFHIDIDNKGNIDTVATTIKMRSVSKKYLNKSTSDDFVRKETTKDRKAYFKSVLRTKPNHLQDYSEQLRFSQHPYSFSSNSKRPMNRYKVFDISHEISKEPPFVLTKQINIGYTEAPYYVPVYDYAPKNAFYNAYNRFGPNYEKNDDLIETTDPRLYNKELSYEVIQHNLEPKYERTHLHKKNGKGNKGRGQRKFKHYQNGAKYKKKNKTAYKNNFLPIKKEKLLNINLHSNDYLDMDYYLGRSSDSPENFNDDFSFEGEEDAAKFSYLKNTSRFDKKHSLGINLYNMKDYIRNIRNQVNLQRNSDKTKTMNANVRNLRDKLKIVDNILANPMFRGLNSSLVFFIPKTRTTSVGPQESRDKNFADDYYFSRMSSGEETFLDDIVAPNQEVKINPDEDTELKKKQILKTNTKGNDTVVRERQFQFPFELDNLLKMDLAVRDNKLNVIFREVKKPVPNNSSSLLNVHLNVLKDMIETDNKGLVQFDWLGSTVDVQSALKKLIDLTDVMHVSDDIHHSDRELFRYVLFLYKISMKSLIEAIERRRSANERNELDKSLNKRNMMPTIGLHQFEAYEEVKKYMKEMRELNIDVYDYLLNQFGLFLTDLRENLNELHEAIKAIAVVTKYSRQRWYHDLKDLYLSPLDRKVTLKLLLHLSTTRLFGLIEDSAQNGLEENFVDYVRSHKIEVERTREEFVFVLRLLKEINRLKN